MVTLLYVALWICGDAGFCFGKASEDSRLWYRRNRVDELLGRVMLCCGSITRSWTVRSWDLLEHTRVVRAPKSSSTECCPDLENPGWNRARRNEKPATTLASRPPEMPALAADVVFQPLGRYRLRKWQCVGVLGVAAHDATTGKFGAVACSALLPISNRCELPAQAAVAVPSSGWLGLGHSEKIAADGCPAARAKAAQHS